MRELPPCSVVRAWHGCCAFLLLRALCCQVVDVSYGGDNGFNQAIQLSADALANVKVGLGGTGVYGASAGGAL
jgi:hypothetical protein